MQAHAKFIFHLDEPREQCRRRPVRLRGWIASDEQLSELQLAGWESRRLKLEERPDVQRAFPNYAFATGFDDKVDPADFREGALHFSFMVGDTRNTAEERLPKPPRAPSWPVRLWLKWRRAKALRRMCSARDPHSRWKTLLSAFLHEVQIARGGDFRREENDRLIAVFADTFPDAFVVQIGANDGIAGDPLAGAFARTQWSGLLVEPVPHLYEMLVARYRDRPGVSVERAAVSTEDGDAPLYRLRAIPGQTPEWFNQLATLDRRVLLKHRSSIPQIDSLIVEERVPTVRLDTLLAHHEISRIDLLVIDTEGHDLEVLRSLDFARFRPTLVMFEHQHLSESDKKAAYALVETAGYDFRETIEGDAIAWQKAGNL